MIPILTLPEIVDVEKKSSSEHGLSEYDMIMSAGEAVFQSIKSMLEQADDEDFSADYFPQDEEQNSDENQPPHQEVDQERQADLQKVVAFVCGKGHNGADGLSAALLSAQAGYHVVIYQIFSEQYSPEVLRLQGQLADAEIPLLSIRSAVDLPVFQNADLIVDGLLGSGISGDPEGLLQSVIFGINRSGIPVLSIDVPSGVACDSSSVKGTSVKASATLCLGAMKLSANFYPAITAFGKVGYSPICFDEKMLVQQSSNMHLYTEEDALEAMPTKTYRSTKYTSGKVLVLAGSRGMHGAAALGTNAALRAGAGLVRAVLPAGIFSDISAHLLEVIGMPVGQDEDRHFSPAHIDEILPWLDWADSILIGPGLGRHPETDAFVALIMPHLRGRNVVIDGDGLGYFHPDHPERRLGEGLEQWVVTPHPGEFQRMGGIYNYDSPLDLLKDMRKFTQACGFSVTLKGPTSIYAVPHGMIVIIPAGNPGMATAGSGDVLAGIMTAFMAKKSAQAAAPLAVYIHGRSGDIARRDRGTLGMAASDLILYLPLALKELEDIALDAEEEMEGE